jgi:hypothetical protein
VWRTQVKGLKRKTKREKKATHFLACLRLSAARWSRHGFLPEDAKAELLTLLMAT